MYSLFIDTHSGLIRLCLYKDNTIIEIKEIESIMNHSDYLMPNIKVIIENNNLTINELNEILVINGPGSFTGVRLGVTVAKMLAYTLNVRIKTMTSLDMFAFSNDKEYKIVSIDDVKGYYCATYTNNNLDQNYMYLTKTEYFDFIKGKEDKVIDNKVDYLKIKEKFNEIEPILSHIVNPIYIKIIEALK